MGRIAREGLIVAYGVTEPAAGSNVAALKCRADPVEEGGELKCIFDAGEGMITTADLSYDGKEVVFALRRGGHVGSNPVAHIEDISRCEAEKDNYQIFW